MQALIAGKLSLVSSPDLIQHIYHCIWVGFGSGTETTAMCEALAVSTDKCKLLSIVSPRIVSTLITVS